MDIDVVFRVVGVRSFEGREAPKGVIVESPLEWEEGAVSSHGYVGCVGASFEVGGAGDDFYIRYFECVLIRNTLRILRGIRS